MQSSFTIQTKDLKAALSAMNRIGSKFQKPSVLKISVLPNAIEIATQGIVKILKAETGYANTNKSATMQFTFKPGKLR